jgi:hypothetical protein
VSKICNKLSNTNQFCEEITTQQQTILGRRTSHELLSFYVAHAHAFGYPNSVTVFFILSDLGQQVPRHDVGSIANQNQFCEEITTQQQTILGRRTFHDRYFDFTLLLGIQNQLRFFISSDLGRDLGQQVPQHDVGSKVLLLYFRCLFDQSSHSWRWH